MRYVRILPHPFGNREALPDDFLHASDVRHRRPDQHPNTPDTHDESSAPHRPAVGLSSSGVGSRVRGIPGSRIKGSIDLTYSLAHSSQRRAESRSDSSAAPSGSPIRRSTAKQYSVRTVTSCHRPAWSRSTSASWSRTASFFASSIAACQRTSRFALACCSSCLRRTSSTARASISPRITPRASSSVRLFRSRQRPGRAVSLSYLPSVGLSWSFVRSADPGVSGMAVSLSPLDGSKNLAARSPATTRPLMGIRDSIAV
ncbi:hypothetical protein GA0115260_117376 [Streptomyces sp. MnatMP-M27]|nr:hypothetical protein GA0115260_117376 [Streptomyces sp. MnatMP-M27]